MLNILVKQHHKDGSSLPKFQTIISKEHDKGYVYCEN